MTTLDPSQHKPVNGASVGPVMRPLVLFGLGWLALGCVPKVSASIVVTEPDEPEPDEPEDKADKPKRASGDRLPPQVLRAEMVGEGILRIHFSEPLGALDGFDPNDFRISVLNIHESYGYDYYARYGNNYNYNAPEEISYTYANYEDLGYSYYGDVLRFGEWQVHDGELTLLFTPPLGPDVCRMISYGNYGPGYSSGLFLHYASGSIPVRDQSGYPLANIGADWVQRARSGRADEGLSLEGSRAEQAGESLIPIDCTPQLPPGPR